MSVGTYAVQAGEYKDQFEQLKKDLAATNIHIDATDRRLEEQKKDESKRSEDLRRELDLIDSDIRLIQYKLESEKRR